MNVDHTHPVNETSFKHLPRQRRMNDVERTAVESMLRMRPNKKILQAELLKDTGKYVMLKDIHNMQTRICPKSDADSLLAEMRKVPGATVEVLVTAANIIQGIFFQTKEMKLAFSEFPEVLMVDATYKLNDIRMPLYLLMVIDGNGESEIAALWIVQSEDRQTVGSMTSKFRRHNPAWNRVRVIMADKDMVERDVFRTQLPEAQLMICLFHTLRTFKREITTDKMGITVAQRDACREMITNLTYARCETHYQELYEIFRGAAPQQVLDYYDKQWHSIRAEWVEGLKSEMMTLLTSTNNRIESTNQKLKAVICRYSSMVDFFRSLMITVNSMSIERDHRALLISQKVPLKIYSDGSPEQAYLDMLTPYAFRFVKVELERRTRANIEVQGSRYVVTSGPRLLEVSSLSCNCEFWTAMSLPCRHILAVRQREGLAVFDGTLVAQRWMKVYYLNSHRVFQPDHDTPAAELTVSQHLPRLVPSQHDKYRKSVAATKRLTSLLSNVPTREFQHVLRAVETISDILTKGGHFVVVEVEDRNEDATSPRCPVQEDDLHDDAVFQLPATPQRVSHTVQRCPVQDDDAVPVARQKRQKRVPERFRRSLMTCVVSTKVSAADENPLTTSEWLLEPSVPMQLPIKVQKRGRPKGAEQTAIGLPAKRRCLNKPVAFRKKDPLQKNKIILGWLVRGRSNRGPGWHTHGARGR